jgi:NADH-quinone oxidoreductase subunit C
MSDEVTETVEAEVVGALSNDNAALLASVTEAFGADSIVEHGESLGDLIVRVTNESWLAVANACKTTLAYDYLSFIGAIDWMPAPSADEGSGDTSAPVQPKEQTYGVAGSTGRFQVFARVASTRVPRSGLTLKVDLDEQSPSVASWVSVYPGADWHERETWEMYGITFVGHPSLRHLYLPSEFEGNPLRKDFPLLAREVKPWPGLVDVEPMPGEAAEETEATSEGASSDGGE